MKVMECVFMMLLDMLQFYSCTYL